MAEPRKPQRIQRKRTKGWRMPEGVVYVGRRSDWGNPWSVGATLDLPYGYCPMKIDRELAVELYRHYTRQRGWANQIRDELAGKDLACWCPVDQPCHADVLLEIANGSGASG